MKMTISKLRSVLFVAALLAFAGTAMATTVEVEVSTFDELKAAIQNTSVDVINVAADIDVPCGASNTDNMTSTATLKVDRDLTIQGKNAVQKTIKRTGSTDATGNGSYLNRSILEIYGDGTYDNVTVTLRNIIFDGGAKWASGSTPQTRHENRGAHAGYGKNADAKYGKSSLNNGVAGRSIIDVANKATLNLESGAVVQNGECTNNSRTGSNLEEDNLTNTYGGCIRVECYKDTGGGTVNVKSGAVVQDGVASSYGGGIGAYNLARINIYGGTIRRCSAKLGGGIGVTWADDAYDPSTAGKAASKTHAGVISTSGGLIEDCWCSVYGAALVVEGTAVDCEGDSYYQYSRILGLNAKNCVAEQKGAAIAVNEGSSTTIYLANSPAVTATDCTGSGNYTDQGYVASSCIYKSDNSVIVEITSIHTVSFIDGADQYGQVEVEHGRTAGPMFPADPARTGMVFTEWRTNLLDSASTITKDTVINSDVTAYAYWVSVKVSLDDATVPNTTYQVLLKNSPITPDSTGKYYVPSNEQNIVVVYKASSGYYFEDGTTEKTNAVITSTNPATVQTPLPAAASNHKHCICGTGTCAVGGHTHADIVWAEWTKTDSLPTSTGNYYLANDITLTAEYKPVNGVNLCLNGHTVTQTTSGKRVISVVSTSSMTDHTFALTDCVQTGKITGGTITGSNNYGGGVNVATNSSVASGKSVFKYYGGIICGNTATSVANNGSGCGGGVCVNSGCEFYMYGGVVSNNTATSIDNYTGTGRGGGLFVSGTAKAFVYGGDICYNTANRYGGGVEIGSGSSDVKPTMTFGGTARIFGNKGGCGGGICCDTGSQLTVTGGEIFGNEAKDDYLKGGDKGKGGGIFLYAGPHAISDCSIYNNTASVHGGGFYYDDASAVTIGGKVVVTNNTFGGALENCYFSSGKKVTLSSLASGSKIGVTLASAPAKGAKTAFTTNGSSSDLAKFASDDAKYNVVYDTDHLALEYPDIVYVEVKAPDPMPANTTFKVYTNGVEVAKSGDKYLVVTNSANVKVVFKADDDYYFDDGTTAKTNAVNAAKNPAEIQGTIPSAPTQHKHCLCGTGACAVEGHSHSDIAWKPWTSTTTLPTAAGNYYLTNNVTLTATYFPVDGVNLCLNGKSVTQTVADNSVIGVTADRTFTLTDCSGNKGIVTSGGLNCGVDKAGVNNNGTFNFYAGTITNIVVQHNSGGVRNAGTMTMYGGRITGCSCNKGGTDNRARGGGIYNDHVLYMKGGEIDHCTTAWIGGGVANLFDSAEMYMTGGVFHDNSIAGIYAGKTLVVTGGALTNNAVAGIYVRDNAAETWYTGLTLGGDVKMSGNGDSGIYFQVGSAAISKTVPLASGVKIGINAGDAPQPWTPVVVFTNAVSADLAKFELVSDSAAYELVYDNTKLLIRMPDVAVTDPSLANVTFSVLTNDAAVAKVGGEYLVPSNATFKVVYTAADGYFFADGSTAITNALTAGTNPVVDSSAPSAPQRKDYYVSSTGSDANSGSPTAPFATITNAIVKSAGRKTTIHVMTDLVQDPFDLSKFGVADTTDITITSDDNDSATTDDQFVIYPAKDGSVTFWTLGQGDASSHYFNAALCLTNIVLDGRIGGSTGTTKFGMGAIKVIGNGTTTLADGFIVRNFQTAEGNSVYAIVEEHIGKLYIREGALLTSNTIRSGQSSYTSNAQGVINIGGQASLYMTGGLINGNTATGTASSMINLGTSCKAYLTGGAISNNVMYTSDSFACYKRMVNETTPNASDYYFGGTIVVCDNKDANGKQKNIHIPKNATAHLSEALTGDAKIGLYIVGDVSGELCVADGASYTPVTSDTTHIAMDRDANYHVFLKDADKKIYIARHSWTYAVDAGHTDTLYAYCPFSGCPHSGSATDLSKAISIKLVTPGAEAGTPYTGAYLEGTNVWFEAGLTNPPLSYATSGSSSYVPTAPSAYGDYLAKATISNALYATSTFSLTSNVVFVEVKAPDPLPANTTFKVYTNGVELTKTGGKYLVPTNAADVAVVYVADSGFYFPGGNTAVTNELESSATGTDPVTLPAAPAAPMPPVKYVAPVYKGTDNNPTNGIARWVTNTVYGSIAVMPSTSAVEWGAAGVTNWYVVTNNVEISGGITCLGYVNLILCDGAKLMVTGDDDVAGIAATDPDEDGSYFTVYAQEDGTGELEVSGGEKAAAIGGNKSDDGRNITINGGIVTAFGGDQATGIGGGFGGDGVNLVINGGTVKAMAGDNCAAIGGDHGGVAEGVVINGGTIAVLGNEYSDLIGSGKSRKESTDVLIAPTANILFSVCGDTDPLPTDIEGFVVMTPMTQSVDRVLVTGFDDSTTWNTFALTNLETGAAKTITVNGARPQYFAARFLSITNDASSLVLKSVEAVEVIPEEVTNTTYKVYWGDEEVSGPPFYVPKDASPVTIVYTADDGYKFPDGSTAKTNTLDKTATGNNPASPLPPPPSAPVAAVATVTTNAVTTYYGDINVAWSNACFGTEANPATLTLLTDIALTNQLNTSTNAIYLKLDLNDHVLSSEITVSVFDKNRMINFTSVTGRFDIVDLAAVKTKKYFTETTSGLWVLTNETTALFVEGGVITGARSNTAVRVSYCSCEIRDVSFVGNNTISSGATLYLDGDSDKKCLCNIYNTRFYGNVASVSGGAIFATPTSKFLMKGCDIRHNVANKGGGIYGHNKCVILDTTITDNTATESGAGIYYEKNTGCLAAGTKILMADGTEKAIEDVVEGDLVATFDHEGGTNASSRIYLAYKGSSKARPFTLEFDTQMSTSTSSLHLSIVDLHDLLEETSRKYVRITEANAASFVGKRFYGADGAWHTLTRVTSAAEPVAYYSIYAAQHQNVYANGLLTVADDADFILNIYELDANLKADPAQLAADVSTYGLVTSEYAMSKYGMDRPYFDDGGVKYLFVAIGKGLVTLDEVVSAYRTTGGGASASPASAFAAAPLFASAPLLGAPSPEPTLDDFAAYGDGVLVLGANAVVTNNFVGAITNSNIHLASTSSLIALADDHTGVIAGVTRFEAPGEITTTNDLTTAADVIYLPSDDSRYVTRFSTNKYLRLALLSKVAPETIDHTSYTIYTNGVPITESTITVPDDIVVQVVYQTDPDWYFSNRVSVVTNDVDVTTNPATVLMPPATPEQYVQIIPEEVDNTTYKVYLDDEEITPPPYYVPSNASPVKIVYETKPGYIFPDGTTTKTNELELTATGNDPASPLPTPPPAGAFIITNQTTLTQAISLLNAQTNYCTATWYIGADFTVTEKNVINKKYSRLTILGNGHVLTADSAEYRSSVFEFTQKTTKKQYLNFSDLVLVVTNNFCDGIVLDGYGYYKSATSIIAAFDNVTVELAHAAAPQKAGVDVDCVAIVGRYSKITLTNICTIAADTWSRSAIDLVSTNNASAKITIGGNDVTFVDKRAPNTIAVEPLVKYTNEEGGSTSQSFISRAHLTKVSLMNGSGWSLTVPLTPTSVAHTTYKVYVGGKEFTGKAPFNVPSNGVPVEVVYTPADGYTFPDGTTAKTNDVDMTTYPPTVMGDLPPAGAFIITNQTTLTKAISTLRKQPDGCEETWYIGADFTVTNKNSVSKAFNRLTILGNNYTITAAGEAYYDYALVFGARFSACEHKLDVRDLGLVVSNNFRGGIYFQGATNNVPLDVTLNNVDVTMAYASAPKREGEELLGAPVVNNYSKLALTNGCSFTADKWSWAAIDVTSMTNRDASLTILSDDITFVDNRTPETIALEPLITQCDGDGGTVTITGIEKTPLKWVELANNHGYSYVVPFTPTSVEHTTNKVYAAGKEIPGVPYYVPSNAAPVYVVYIADEDYFFDDGMTSNTNLIDTTTNPPTVLGSLPNAPHTVQIISYDAMEGAWADGVTVSNLAATLDQRYALPAYAPARTRYTFKGWYASWTNGAAKIENGDALVANENHSIYAKWISDEYNEGEDNTFNHEDIDDETVVVTGVQTNGDGSVSNPFDDGKLDFPERIDNTVDGSVVTWIGRRSFSAANYDKKVAANKQLTSVTLSTYITDIGDEAFRGASKLTNVCFVVARDYKTNEKKVLDIGSRAFEAAAVETVVIPAGAKVRLRSNAFAKCAKLKEIYVYGEIEGCEKGPFNLSGTASDAVVIHLSPAYAADAEFVSALTNGLSTANVKLSSEPLGKVVDLSLPSFAVAGKVSFSFKVDLDSPWGEVNSDTVTMFYTDDLPEGFVGTGKVKPALAVSGPDASGNYTAEFEDPALPAESRFYRLTVGK